MPRPDLTAPFVTHSGPADRERALDVLLGPDLEHVVALVAWCEDGQVYVANARGRVRFPIVRPEAPRELLAGIDPLAADDLFDDGDRVYPLAGPRLASLFAERRAPDLAVVHAGAHYWPERAGHPGEHGSLNGIQSRAPLLLSGAGVAARGILPRVVRTVDVAATLCRLTGASYDGMDGRPIAEAEPGARHVVGLLWDGAQCADLLALAQAGELPAVGRLLERGCAFAGGAIAEFPSVTLVNHTSALTGLGPGRHGIVHNAYFDRETGERVVPNDSAQWHRACDWLRPGVQTVWERVAAGRPGVSTACVDEPIDRGAGYSTFALVRVAHGDGSAPDGAKSLGDQLPDARSDPHATLEQVRANGDYSWGTQIDGLGLNQVVGLWSEGTTPPDLMWWNTTVTDAAHHAGGPRSEIARASMRDSDRRLGVFLDLVEARGLSDEVTILLTADHGSQAADPKLRGDWDDALTAAGVSVRDEGYGFLYFGD